MASSLDICNARVKMRHANRDYNCNVHFSNDSKKNSKEEASAIRMKFPTKMPIIVERYYKEIDLPHLDKRKFLVPQELTMSQFVAIIRNRMKIGPTRALFILVNNRAMVSLSKTIAEIYAEHRSMDGFLYMTYASQEVFGNDDDDSLNCNNNNNNNNNNAKIMGNQLKEKHHPNNCIYYYHYSDHRNIKKRIK